MNMDVCTRGSSVSFGAYWSMLAITLSCCGSAQAQVTNQIQLPIEVMPLAPTNAADAYPFTPPATASQTITVAPPSGAAFLWMKIHGTSYPAKMSISFNGGTPIPINNSTTGLVIADPERSYGGIGSTYPVMEMTLPLSNWTQGVPNTIQFIFNGTDGVSTGFRVIDLNILTTTGAALLPVGDVSNGVSYDTNADNTNNPANWSEPLTNSADILAGQNLYQGSTNAPALYASPLTTNTITASCADCHTLNGHDLKYFNYSNQSIEARSQFHGLTPKQGMQIASYIRSLTWVNPGRPWNPPYQPGTNLDILPVSSWAAGGGLDSVVTTDGVQGADAAAVNTYLFPNGISPNANAINTSQTLNARTTPTEFMLLDWNHWLPRVHPKDATSTYLGTNFLNSAADAYYNGDGTNTAQPIMQKMQGWINSTNWATVKSALNNWETQTQNLGNPMINQFTSNPSTGTTNSAGELYSLKQWKEVKMWDVMTTFGLEGSGQQLVGTNSEHATWPTGESFQTSPNRNFIPWNTNNFVNPNTNYSQVDYEYINNAWYQLQFILNAGNRARSGNDPIDWPYIRGRVTGVMLMSTNSGLPTGWPEASRMVMDLVKGMQQNDGTNQAPPVDYTHNGWSPRDTGNVSQLVSPNYIGMWSDFTPSQKRQILNAMTKVWFTKIGYYTKDQYYADLNGVDGPTNALPATTNAWASEHYSTNMNGGPLLDQVYGMIPYMHTAGVDNQLLNNICNWGAGIWPANNWTNLETTITNTDLPTTNLVGRWTFDEGFSTNVVDWSDGGTNTGVIQGSPLPAWINSTNLPVAGSQQKVGYGDIALTSANNDQVSVPNWTNVNWTGGGMTITAWAKYNTATGPMTPQMTIANTKGSVPTAAKGFQFYYYPRNATVGIYGGGSSVANASIGTLDTNWHQFAVTVAGTNAQVYFDGVQKTMTPAHTTVGAIVPSTNALIIGAGLDGQLDDVRVYNSALNSNQISNLYKVNQ